MDKGMKVSSLMPIRVKLLWQGGFNNATGLKNWRKKYPMKNWETNSELKNLHYMQPEIKVTWFFIQINGWFVLPIVFTNKWDYMQDQIQCTYKKKCYLEMFVAGMATNIFINTKSVDDAHKPIVRIINQYWWNYANYKVKEQKTYLMGDIIAHHKTSNMFANIYFSIKHFLHKYRANDNITLTKHLSCSVWS